jgi:protein-S-isoprenylcysteine O-methyltransferase Ste14
MVWPIVPLFWIPVHALTRFFKNLGVLTYALPVIAWVPLAYVIYLYRDVLVRFRVAIPVAVHIAGLLLLLSATILHIWTGTLLGIRGLIGLPEISSTVKSRLITRGPFSIVRHPTYLAHTVMFLGVFLISGVLAVAVITFLDIVVINIVIIPLEERELLRRFGDDYEQYKGRVAGFFPRLSRR